MNIRKRLGDSGVVRRGCPQRAGVRSWSCDGALRTDAPYPPSLTDCNNRRVNFSSVVLVLALSLAALAGAQEKRAATGTHHSLWKIQGQQNAVYLLGSIHLLKKEDYPLPAPIEAAFANSRVAVFETDIGAMGNPE